MIYLRTHRGGNQGPIEKATGGQTGPNDLGPRPPLKLNELPVSNRFRAYRRRLEAERERERTWLGLSVTVLGSGIEMGLGWGNE